MKNIISLLLIIVVLGSCKKKNVLPPITQVGANTYGCKMNNKCYKAEGSTEQTGWNGGSWYGPTSVEYFLGTADLNAVFDDRTLRINIDESAVAGDNSNEFIAEVNISGMTSYYRLLKSKPHQLMLLKADSKIYSGTFDFWMANSSDSTDLIHVTEGRFDLLSQ